MTINQPPTSEDFRREVASTIQAHWGLFLFEGILLIVLGAAAIILPVVATLAFTLVIGWLFLISGAVGLVTTFWMRNARACATVGARLTPSAPSAPSAAETPPESRTKSRRERVVN